MHVYRISFQEWEHSEHARGYWVLVAQQERTVMAGNQRQAVRKLREDLNHEIEVREITYIATVQVA